MQTDVQRIRQILPRGQILSKKFNQYLLPSLVTFFALSLSDFVNSIIVANLIGNESMAVISAANPINLIIAAIYNLIGIGGSIVYADKLGRKDEHEAHRIYTVAVTSALGIGLILMVIGLSLNAPLAHLLCPDPGMEPKVARYIRLLMFTAPLMIPILTIVDFLPAAGNPRHATMFNIIANGLNVALVIGMITIFHMDERAAAISLVVSYSVTGIIMFILIFRRKINLRFARFVFSDFKRIPSIYRGGVPDLLTQIGFSLKFAFCNNIATQLGGPSGLIAMSLCIHTLDIVSIFLGGVSNTCVPFLSLLRGQEDYDGVGFLLKRASRVLFLCSFVCAAVFIIFPQVITAIFNTKESSQVQLATHAIRIFSICYLARSNCILFRSYVNVIGKSFYAMFIALFDGFVGIIAIGSALAALMNLDGIWWTYPINAFLLAAIILITNLIIIKRPNSMYKTLWLLEKPEPDTSVCSFYISDGSPKAISDLCISISSYCSEHGVNPRTSNLVSLATEEMTVYTKQHAKDTHLIDLVVKIRTDNIVIDFRSIGQPFDPMTASEQDIPENIKFLHAAASEINYLHVMGMNSTKITVSRQLP